MWRLAWKCKAVWRGVSSMSGGDGSGLSIAKADGNMSPSAMSLCDRIALLKNREVSHAVPIMKEWEEQGNRLDKQTVRTILYKLRQWKRPRHAMEIADWMYFQRPFSLDLNDTISRMEIAGRAKLLRRAQRIFNKLSVQEKTVDAYNVMFLLYSQHKMVLHADDLYYKFKQAKLQPTDYTFTLLACLYRRAGKNFKVIRLQQDMEAAGVEPCRCYLNNLLLSKFEVEGIAAAEEIYERLIPPGAEITHKYLGTFSMMASAYMSAGMHDKALPLMDKIEKGMENGTFMKMRRTYHVLISMHSTLKNLDAMERLWEKIGEHKAHDYVAMIEACGRAGDVERSEKYFKAADRIGYVNQPRLFSSLLNVYAGVGMAEKADVLFKKMKALDVAPDSLCFHYMVLVNLKAKMIHRAVEYLELARLAGNRDGKAKPYVGTLADVFKFLAETGDVTLAETLLGDWRKAKLRVNITLYNHLLRVYMKAGKQVKGDYMKRLAGDCQRPNVETHKLWEELKSLEGDVVGDDYSALTPA